jgi:hypothetical protein
MSGDLGGPPLAEIFIRTASHRGIRFVVGMVLASVADIPSGSVVIRPGRMRHATVEVEPLFPLR